MVISYVFIGKPHFRLSESWPDVLHGPIEDYTQMNIDQYYQENYILAQATRKLLISKSYTNANIDIFIKL